MDKDKIIKMINAYWKFDNDQQHTSNWHDKQDLITAIEQLSIPRVSKRYDEMLFKPPFRVGRKQGKAVLDANGLLVTFFDKSKSQALLFCDYLNNVC